MSRIGLGRVLPFRNQFSIRFIHNLQEIIMIIFPVAQVWGTIYKEKHTVKSTEIVGFDCKNTHENH